MLKYTLFFLITVLVFVSGCKQSLVRPNPATCNANQEVGVNVYVISSFTSVGKIRVDLYNYNYWYDGFDYTLPPDDSRKIRSGETDYPVISFVSNFNMQRVGWVVSLDEVEGSARLTAILNRGGYNYQVENSIGHLLLSGNVVCKTVQTDIGGFFTPLIPIPIKIE